MRRGLMLAVCALLLTGCGEGDAPELRGVDPRGKLDVRIYLGARGDERVDAFTASFTDATPAAERAALRARPLGLRCDFGPGYLAARRVRGDTLTLSGPRDEPPDWLFLLSRLEGSPPARDVVKACELRLPPAGADPQTPTPEEYARGTTYSRVIFERTGGDA